MRHTQIQQGEVPMKHNTMLTIASLARHPHEGGTLRRDRQIPRRLFLRLDALGARRARGLHLHPLGARAVEPATGPVPVVLCELEENARSAKGAIPNGHRAYARIYTIQKKYDAATKEMREAV